MIAHRFPAAAGIVLVFAGLALVPTSALALALADRPAEQILKDLDAVQMPAIPENRNDRAAVQKYITDRMNAQEKRSALILELYQAAPDHERLPQLLAERWMNIPPFGPKAVELNQEIDDVLAHTSNEKLKVEGTFIKARNALVANRSDLDAAMPAIDAFLKLAPKDPRAGSLLYAAARATRDDAKKAALEDRLIQEFPESPYAGMLTGERRQREAVGKPLELEFTDAIKGSTVSMKALKGKVVVLDFWATWCGPCVAEMPNMKKLYAEYRDQGVEFIGVSLDQPREQGGLDKLKEFVAKNEIPWPQYYQGNGWESAFSSKWGINAIPCVFVVDPDGNLYSTDARGKLETIIPELLARKKADAGGE